MHIKCQRYEPEEGINNKKIISCKIINEKLHLNITTIIKCRVNFTLLVECIVIFVFGHQKVFNQFV
jgi:hypothetical protein